MDHLSPIVFETQRLEARELSPADLERVKLLVCRAENSRYMPWSPMSGDEAASFLESCLAAQLTEPRQRYVLALFIRETGEFAGAVSLTLDGERSSASLGYIIAMEHWGSGYGLEAVRGAIRFALLGLDLHRIWAECDDKNAPSVRLLERSGMRLEGHFIKSKRMRIDGRESWRSIFHYAMLQKEYLMGLPDGFHSAVLPDMRDKAL